MKKIEAEEDSARIRGSWRDMEKATLSCRDIPEHADGQDA
jgi:hypothetical protein